jgi:hypothetical protein
MVNDRRVLLAASLGFGVIQLDVSIVNVAVKSIGGSLGGGVTGLQWVAGWRAIFFVNLPLGALVLIISLGSRFSLGRRPTGSGPGRTRIFSRVRAPEPPPMSGYAGRLGDTNPGEDASGRHRAPGGQQAWQPPRGRRCCS